MKYNLFFFSFLFISIYTSSIQNNKEEMIEPEEKIQIDEKDLNEIELGTKKLVCMGIMKNSLANLNSTLRIYMQDKQKFFEITMNIMVDNCIEKITKEEIDFFLKSENINKADDTLIQYRNLLINNEIKSKIEISIEKEKKSIERKEIIKLHLYIIGIFSCFCLLTLLLMYFHNKKKEKSEKQKTQ